MPDKDVSILVSFKFISYTINFVTDCTIQVSSQTIEKNNKAIPVSLENNSECEGFLGWYTEETCLNQFDFDNTPIPQNVTKIGAWAFSTNTNLEYIKTTFIDTTSTWKVRSYNGNGYNNWENFGSVSTDPAKNTDNLSRVYISYEWGKIEQ